MKHRSTLAICLTCSSWLGEASAAPPERSLGVESTLDARGIALGVLGSIVVARHFRTGALVDVHVLRFTREEESCTPPQLARECIRGGVVAAGFAEYHPLLRTFDPYLGLFAGWANREVQEHPRRNDLVVGPTAGLDVRLSNATIGIGARYRFYPTVSLSRQRGDWASDFDYLLRATYEF